MNKWEKYYEKIKNAKCHEIMHKLDDINLNNKNAIELGCGTGRDTLYLLNNRIQGAWSR